MGYGEITPRSFLGRLVTLPLLLFGLFLIALPSFVLGREFSIVWEKMAPKKPVEGDLDFDAGDVDDPHPSDPFFGRSSRPPTTFELSGQIKALTQTVETQGKLIQRLVDLLDKGKDREHVS